MIYVVYNVATTKLLNKTVYKTESAAKAGLTRWLKREGNWLACREDFAVADVNSFYDTIEKTVERVNAMTGNTFKERVNTSYACSPSNEAYWSS